jgi:type IX secretion system PorP/SprF family membrane protein
MKKLITKVAVAVAGFTSVLMAQQDPQFTQFMHSKLIYNPGYAGTSNAICANILYRKQWVNFPGAPSTGLLSADMRVIPALGVGINLMSDQIGADKTFFGRVAVAYNKNIGNGTLGVGIDAGILQKQINQDWIAPEPGKNDVAIPGYAGQTGSSANPNLSKMTYDLGFGIFYQIPNRAYVGLSSTHLPAQTLKNGGDSDGKNGVDVKFAMARHYYIIAGYMHPLNPRNEIGANLKVKSDAATTQLDINLMYEWNRTFWLGVTYRMEDAIAPMLGVRLLNQSLKIGYSYDYTLSKIKGYTSGTHEIMLSYCLVKKKAKPTVYGNVRFLD